MRHRKHTDADHRVGSPAPTLAKVLAPEDVRAGDYVALLQVVFEVPSFLWCGGTGANHPDEPVRMSLIPKNGGMPHRVLSVCLPFVLAKTPTGQVRHLDTRRHRLARLDRAHARTVWKACKQCRPTRTRV